MKFNMKVFKVFVPLLFAAVLMHGCSSQSNTSEPTVIADLNQFNKITSSDLKGIMGEPETSEDWTNKTTKGDFPVTTYGYDKEDGHYDFIISNDIVVRCTISSNKFWKNEGEDFTYKNKKDITTMFGITISDTTVVEKDIDTAYRLSNVNDNISGFLIQEMDTNKKTFSIAKVTYDANCFD